MPKRLTAVAAAVMLALAAAVCPSAAGADDWPPKIERRLPPKGIAINEADRARLGNRAAELKAQLLQVDLHGPQSLPADIAIYIKAVELALRFDEFYKPADVNKAADLLATASARLQQAKQGAAPNAWPKQHGLVVRGYLSSIDHSPQPYGLQIPEDLDLSRPVPLYVWLHGRGDANTDLHFIYDRQRRKGPISPPGAIVLHAFGRQCIGYKSAGEVDVLEAIESVKQRYKIDENRIVLMGFSMGGAGCWLLGAHYADHWVAMSPGAGFVETARYNHLKLDNYPPIYEQKLWGVNDVTDYVRNLFNLPVVAYSGEVDKQKQAADMMAAAFKAEGREMTHLIGPGMGHRYHPDVLADIMRRMDDAVKMGRDRYPSHVSLQTRTLRYNRMFWLQVTALEQHWLDSRADASVQSDGHVVITTKNVRGLHIHSPLGATNPIKAGTPIVVDGDVIKFPDDRLEVDLVKAGKWMSLKQSSPFSRLNKVHGLQGPIDDAFVEPFIIVTPTGKCASAAMQRWVDFELAHFKARWASVFRGDVRVVKDTDVLASPDRFKLNLILWGDRASNRVIATIADQLPIGWTDASVTVGPHKYDAATHVPMLIYPNPLNPKHYVVINSGPTFREGHDRTNSLQNPKLGDWAVIDLSQPPDALTPGKVAAAGFFDEHWQLKSE